MKRSILFLLSAVLLQSACKQESFDERCEREAKEFSKRYCPKRLEKDVILDSIVYNKDTHTRTDYHTVSGIIDDSAVLAKSKEMFRQTAVEAIKKNIELKELKDKRVRFIYRFRSLKSQKELMTVTITSKEYEPN